MRILVLSVLFISLTLGAQNLIVNPGAEIEPLDLNGWTEGCFDVANCQWIGIPAEKDLTYGPGTQTHSGSGHFYPGDSYWTNNDSLYQIVDISAYASAIDAGTASFTFSCWMSIYRPNNDKVRVAWSFLNSSGTTLRYTTSGNLFYNGITGTATLLTWYQYSSTITAPVNSRRIRVSMFAVYNSSGTAADSYYDDLSLTTTATLPVSLINFTATEKEKSILLSWNTTSETNNDFFTIEKSMDGNNWFEIGKVNGSGNSNNLKNYYFEDLNPRLGIQYYRLRQTDIDGLEAHYDGISVNYRSENIIQVFPNPTSGNVNVVVSGSVESSIFRLINLTGQLLFESTQSGNEVTLDLSEVPSGWYVLEHINGEEISRVSLRKD